MPELIPVRAGSPEWFSARQKGVTATDIVTIIGLSRYDSVYSLFWRKLGQIGEVEDNDRFRLGRELEPYIFDRWDQDQGGTSSINGSLYRHDVRTWQMATPDRVLIDVVPPRFTGVLECKSWADADRHAWDTAPPPQVRAQVLWQMDVMGVAAGHVGVVFLPSGEFRSYKISHASTRPHPGCDVCDDIALMRAAGEEFMARLRLELPPPDPDSSAATLAAVRARFARVPAKQAEIDAPTFGRWIDAKQQSDHWDRLMRGYEIELREQAGEAAELCVDGLVVARRIISHATVKEHVRHQDYLRRVGQQGDDDE